MRTPIQIFKDLDADDRDRLRTAFTIIGGIATISTISYGFWIAGAKKRRTKAYIVLIVEAELPEQLDLLEKKIREELKDDRLTTEEYTYLKDIIFERREELKSEDVVA